MGHENPAFQTFMTAPSKKLKDNNKNWQKDNNDLAFDSPQVFLIYTLWQN